MAEAWLKELLRIAVRNHGVTAITTETIALAASDYQVTEKVWNSNYFWRRCSGLANSSKHTAETTLVGAHHPLG